MCFPQFYNKAKLWAAGPARYVQTSGRLKTEHVYSAYSSNTVRLYGITQPLMWMHKYLK